VCLKPNKQTVRIQDQLLPAFSSTALTLGFSLSLANNAEITAEDIYEVLVGACADRTSDRVRSVRRARTHPLGTRSSTIFGRSSSRNSSNESLTLLLRKDLDELLPEQVEVCADLHLRLR